MKKISFIALIASLFVCSGCAMIRNITWDETRLLSAVANTVSATTLTDIQLNSIGRQTIAKLDAQNVIDNGAYARRIEKVMKGANNIEGLPINIKVYRSSEINAFACPDGSIRVFSGLMDVMTDDELTAIIGHECGHIVHQDTKAAMRNAYLSQAVTDVLAASNSTVGALADGVLGQLAQQFVASKFSQKQEFNADAYGYKFATDNGCDEYSMYNSLNKLLKVSGSSQSSLVAKLFASHPDTEERAARMKAKADAAKKK